jgi:hypothetical protein
MKLRDAARRLFLNDRLLSFTMLLFMALCYGVILFNAGVHSRENLQDLTFNSMLDHLMHGRFDVDPNIVGGEGYERNGNVYAYWGITGALIRLPLIPFHRLDLDVTTLSCLVAVCLAGFMKVRTLLFLRQFRGSAPVSNLAYGLMLAYVALGGAEIGYLRSSIFQEVVSWAVAFASIFVYFAVKGLLSGQFTAATLSSMACAAGFALLTRVSTGMGLYAALGLLMLVLLAEEFRVKHTNLTGRILIPAAILTVFVIAVGAVNYSRWGNPWTFTGGSYILYNGHPERLIPLHLYGVFNLARVPLGLIYYFLPVWALHGPHRRLLFESAQYRLLDNIQLPPSSFFLTDLMPIVFIALLAITLWTSRQDLLGGFRRDWGLAQGTKTLTPSLRLFSPAQGLALAAGLAVPCLLMLSFIWMCYRYRMEFYPEMDFLAFLGLYVTVSNPSLLARFNRLRRWMLTAIVVSIVSAFAAMVLYKLSPWGPAQLELRNGLVQCYLQSLGRHLFTH